MSFRRIVGPEEWERITGTPRVRWIVELPPAKRPRPSQKLPEQEVDRDQGDE